MPDEPPEVPPIRVTVTDVADREIDPHQEAMLAAEGWKDSGWIERLVVAAFTGLVRLAKPLLVLTFEVIDGLMAVLGESFLAAQGEQSPTFYDLVAALVTDMTGVEVDATQLKTAFAQRGRVAAMQQTGGAFLDVLASEFAGVEQEAGEHGFRGHRGDGIGGLPKVDLTPEQGMDAMRAFLGFAMSFAVREGNTDIFAEVLPLGIGRGFKDFGEDLSKNLGIGRLTRLVLRPLVQGLVATPVTWATNKQYRPKELGPKEAIRGWLSGVFDLDTLNEELARQGYSDEKIRALIAQNLRELSITQLRTLKIFGLITPADYTDALRKLGFLSTDIEQLELAEDRVEIRQEALAATRRLLSHVLAGEVTGDEFLEAIQKFPLTEAERDGFQGIVGTELSFPRKVPTLAKMQDAFAQGIIDLREWDDYLIRVGYRQDDRQILTLLMLLKSAKLKKSATKMLADRKATIAATRKGAGLPTEHLEESAPE